MRKVTSPRGATTGDVDLFDDALSDDWDDDVDPQAAGDDEEPASLVTDGDDLEQAFDARDLEKVRALESINLENSQEHLLIPNYPEDAAVRHATLDATSWWHEGELAYSQHGSIEVQMRHLGEPLPLEQVQERLQRFGVRTMLTVRIAMGLWNLRRCDQRLCWNGATAIRAEELLYWLGIEKHAKAVGETRRTDGWRPEEYAVLERDLRLVASLWVCGTQRIPQRGKYVTLEVEASYIHLSLLRTRNIARLYGFFLSPGPWINAYQEHDIYYLAPLTRRIFALHPQNDQHAVRLALYLTERWRKLSSKRAYATPISMEQLLRESAITIPERNDARFAARIEEALTKLQQSGIVGHCERMAQHTDRRVTQRFRFSAWLGSEWTIAPPEEIMAALNRAVQPPRALHPFRNKRIKKQTGA